MLGMDEMKPCLLSLIILSSAFSGTDTTNAAITVSPRVAVALSNDSTVFNCSTAAQEVEWFFGSDSQPIYSYTKVNEPYKDLFQVETYNHNNRKFFNLILHSVTKENGGPYICKDPANQNDEGETVHLTVLEKEPVCESSLNVDGLIGPNSCAITPETVQLSCSVRYIGDQVPELQWIKTNENIAIDSSKCSDSGNIYTCNLTMESELQMEGSSYVCQTTQSMTRQYNCTSGIFRIMYALGEHAELNRTVNDKVNCSVNSNSQACTLSWMFDNGTTNWIESHERVTEFKRPGRYICQADCAIRNNKCTFTAMTVIISAKPLTIMTITVSAETQGDGIPIVGIVVGIPVAVIAVCVIAFILWKVIRRKKTIENEKRKDCSMKYSAQPEQFMLPDVEHDEVTSNEQNPPERAEHDGDASSREDQPEREGLLKAETVGAVETSNEQDESGRDAMSQSAEQAEGYKIPRTITPMEDGNRNRRVRGLTILNDELFVAFDISDIIEIFPIDISALNRSSTVNDLRDPGAIAACATNNCLYIMDQRRSKPIKKIFRVKPDGNIINTWDTDDGDRGRISVNRDGNVVMTVYDKHKLKIYSPDGILLTEKTIDLSQTSIAYIYHAINLADGNFILCHGMRAEISKLHQVCKIDATGNVIRSFGTERGSDSAHLRTPVYLAERKDGSILVADQDNNRVILFSSELSFKTELFTKENGNVSLPEAICIYEKTERPRLFLGCNETSKSGGYILDCQ